jgi:hypothetical protein
MKKIFSMPTNEKTIKWQCPNLLRLKECILLFHEQNWDKINYDFCRDVFTQNNTIPKYVFFCFMYVNDKKFQKIRAMFVALHKSTYVLVNKMCSSDLFIV